MGQQDDSKRGMGSTVIALQLEGADYEIAWVGDSRAYLWDGSLKQLSRDHSYVESLLANGAISYEELAHHPSRHLITQAVGAGEAPLQIDTLRGCLARGQQMLLCSDGLVDELSDGRIAEILREAGEPQTVVDKLVAEALAAGGRDNITVVLVSALQGPRQGCHPEPVAVTAEDGVTRRHHQEVASPGEPPLPAPAVGFGRWPFAILLLALIGLLLWFL
jgi:protein phosphatase